MAKREKVECKEAYKEQQMSETDLQFLAILLDRSGWLLYGDFEPLLDALLRKVFGRPLNEWGWRKIPASDDFYAAYWQLVSTFDRLGLCEYGTSPRGAWLTKDGERFRDLILASDDSLADACDYLRQQDSPHNVTTTTDKP